MRKEYKVGEDIFLATGVFLVAASLILKVFNVSLDLGITTAYPKHILTLGVVSLLLNIAFNIQELVRK
jgi:hypothetical protein